MNWTCLNLNCQKTATVICPECHFGRYCSQECLDLHRYQHEEDCDELKTYDVERMLTWLKEYYSMSAMQIKMMNSTTNMAYRPGCDRIIEVQTDVKILYDQITAKNNDRYIYPFLIFRSGVHGSMTEPPKDRLYVHTAFRNGQTIVGLMDLDLPLAPNPPFYDPKDNPCQIV